MNDAVLPVEFTIKNDNELYLFGFYFCDEALPKAKSFFVALTNDAVAGELYCEVHLLNGEGKTIKTLKEKKETKDEV